MIRPLLRNACLLALPVLLAACSIFTKLTPEDLGHKLSLSLQDAEELSFFDNHGGFHNDGILCVTLKVNPDVVLKQIQADSRWKQLPLDQVPQTLLRKTDFTILGLDINTSVPPIREGYYLFLDRHPKAKTEPDLLKRSSLNMTLAIYDKSTDKLYVIEIDT